MTIMTIDNPLSADDLPEPGALEILLAAVLANDRAVSFTREEDGVLAHVDVFRDDDTVDTYDGTGATPAAALEAAAVSAGLLSEHCAGGDHGACASESYSCACGHHDPLEQLIQAREDLHWLIRAVSAMARRALAADRS